MIVVISIVIVVIRTRCWSWLDNNNSKGKGILLVVKAAMRSITSMAIRIAIPRLQW